MLGHKQASKFTQAWHEYHSEPSGVEIFGIFGDYIVDYFDAIDFVKKLESWYKRDW